MRRHLISVRLIVFTKVFICRPFSFLSTSQSSPRYPAGVTYHSCPFLSTSRAGPPALPVSPDQPEPSLCVPSPSITNTSLGSFHRQTQLNTSNIIGLLQRCNNRHSVLSNRGCADGYYSDHGVWKFSCYIRLMGTY